MSLQFFYFVCGTYRQPAVFNDVFVVFVNFQFATFVMETASLVLISENGYLSYLLNFWPFPSLLFSLAHLFIVVILHHTRTIDTKYFKL